MIPEYQYPQEQANPNRWAQRQLAVKLPYFSSGQVELVGWTPPLAGLESSDPDRVRPEVTTGHHEQARLGAAADATSR